MGTLEERFVRGGSRRPTSAGLMLPILATVVLLAGGCESLSIRMALKEGNQLFNKEKYEEAIVQYQSILDRDPDHWEANYYISAAYMAQYHPGSTHPKDVEHSDKALAGFERCLKLTAPDAEHLEKVRNFYLGLLTSTGRHQQAAEFMEQLFAEAPNNAALASQLAQLYAGQGDFANALKYYERRAALEPQNKEAWYTIGVACWDRSYNGGIMVSAEERGQVIERGIEALNRALQIDAEYFDALSYINLIHREKSKLLVLLGKYDEAQQAYRTAEDYMQKAIEVRDRQKASAPPAGA